MQILEDWAEQNFNFAGEQACFRQGTSVIDTLLYLITNTLQGVVYAVFIELSAAFS